MKALAEQIGDIDGVNIYGRVVGVRGLMVEIAGPIHAMSVGARIVIETGGNRLIPAEVIGFSGNNAVVMPFAGLEGVRRGCRAVIANAASQVRPSAAWLGRVINAMGEPIDGKGPLAQGPSPMPYRNSPPPAHSRKRVGTPLDLGVRSLNTFLTCCRGQRMGIFAGSGVGKSVLLSMLARNADADISVIGLVGERGREVQEFLQDDLGEDGLARSVVVVAISDEPAFQECVQRADADQAVCRPACASAPVAANLRNGIGTGPCASGPLPSIGSPMALRTRPSQEAAGRTWLDALAITARQPRRTPSRPANCITTALLPVKPITSQGINRLVLVSTTIRAPTDIAWIGPATSTINPRTPTTRP